MKCGECGGCYLCDQCEVFAERVGGELWTVCLFLP